MHSRGPDGGASDPELAALRGDPELARTFLAESLDHLSSIESSVLALEQTPDDPQVLSGVFRPFHTLKATAGALGVIDIEQVAHRVEDLLDRARAGTHRIDHAAIELILAAIDLLTHMLRDIQRRLAGRGGADFRDRALALMERIDRVMESPRDSGASSSPDRADDPVPHGMPADPVSDSPTAATIKVDTRKLDGLVELVGELAIIQSMLRQDPQLLGLKNERLERNLAQLSRITTELQKGSISARLVPLRHTFQRMARLVRDLRHQSGKPLELSVSGEETELDRKVVEDISDPLMHMLRNSVDHGIEDAETRRRAGKPAAGRLSLTACHQGGSVRITVADDGSGLDTERIYQRAVAQKLIEPGAPLSEGEIHALIFRPGFTTAPEVTEISGRGIGMDIVRRNVEALRGRIEIRSRSGTGAAFEIKLPLTLATVEGLIVRVGADRFVLPTFSVRESLRPAAGQTHLIPGRGWVLRVREEVIPFARLADLFDIASAVDEPSQGVVVIVEDDLQRLALMVDALIGKQEIVIKSLGEALVKIAGVAGGAILGDGRVGLILDAGELIRFQRNMSARAA